MNMESLSRGISIFLCFCFQSHTIQFVRVLVVFVVCLRHRVVSTNHFLRLLLQVFSCVNYDSFKLKGPPKHWHIFNKNAIGFQSNRSHRFKFHSETINFIAFDSFNIEFFFHEIININREIIVCDTHLELVAFRLPVCVKSMKNY